MAIQGNVMPVLSLLTSTNHETCFFRAVNRNRRTRVHALNSSWELNQVFTLICGSKISMWWHLRGLNPVPLHTKPKLYLGANQALPKPDDKFAKNCVQSSLWHKGHEEGRVDIQIMVIVLSFPKPWDDFSKIQWFFHCQDSACHGDWTQFFCTKCKVLTTELPTL